MRFAGFLAGVVLLTSATARAEEPADSEAQVEQPGWVVGGLVSLGAAAALAVGGVIGAVDDDPRAAVGLMGLATASAGVGLPLLMLGATDVEPVDRETAFAGIAVATPGILATGIGGAALLVQRAEGTEALEVSLPPLIVGAAATVIGVVVWASAAGHDDGASEPPPVSARVQVGPMGASVSGRF